MDVIYTDFSKAFDSVSHTLLISKLRSLGIASPLLSWFASYLTDRQFRVVLDGHYSDWLKVSSGVPQGSNLGPLLFIAFINDLPRLLSPCKSLLYADDLKLYKIISSPADAQILQNSLNSLTDWSDKWHLQLNIDKCSIITFTCKNKPFINNYIMRNSSLSRVQTVSDLGVTLTCSWTLDEHIEKITKKAFQLLGLLRRNCKSFSIDTKIHIYQYLVRSKLEYASIIWTPYQITKINQLERVQRKFMKFLRYTSKLPYDSASYEDYCQFYKLLPLSKRRFVSDCVFMYKSIRLENPTVDFLEYLHVPSHLTRNPSLFYVPYARVNKRFHFPVYRILRHFNTSDIDLTLPLNAFVKTCIVKSLYNNC
jgi:hypothetical protein